MTLLLTRLCLPFQQLDEDRKAKYSIVQAERQEQKTAGERFGESRRLLSNFAVRGPNGGCNNSELGLQAPAGMSRTSQTKKMTALVSQPSPVSCRVTDKIFGSESGLKLPSSLCG